MLHGPSFSSSCSLASPQPHGLAVLLQLRDELVALLNDILVLLVLVVGPVCLDDALACYAVDGTGDAAGGDELGKVPDDGKWLAQDNGATLQEAISGVAAGSWQLTAGRRKKLGLTDPKSRP